RGWPMKLVTLRCPGSAEPSLGLVKDGLVVDLTATYPDEPAFASMLAFIEAGASATATRVDRLLAAPWRVNDPHTSALDDVALLPPIPRPQNNIFCVGLNYLSHVEQNAKALGQTVELPDTPLFFAKPVGAVVGPSAAINLDKELT